MRSGRASSEAGAVEPREAPAGRTSLASRRSRKQPPPSLHPLALVLDDGFELCDQPWTKRAFDVTLALAALVLFMPVVLACALIVAFDSGRPVLFGHPRCGRGGRIFRCLKFRTMVPEAQSILEVDDSLRDHYVRNGYKLPRGRDPRVTRVGHLLRWTHLDELPQLLNVLKGDMSLLGPRPVIPQELEEYEERSNELLSVKPGIFGCWTALGRDRPGYPERVDVELEYLDGSGLMRDLRILARNLPVVLWGQTDA